MITLVTDAGSRDVVASAINIAKEYSDLSHLSVIDLENFGEDEIYLDKSDDDMDGLTIEEIQDKGKLVAVLEYEDVDHWITEYTHEIFESEDSAVLAQWLVDTLPPLGDGSDEDESNAMGGADS